MSHTLAEFIVPPEIARSVCMNSIEKRGIVIEMGDYAAHTVTANLRMLPAGLTSINLHRMVGAPRLLAKLGAIAHGAGVAPFEVRCAIDPTRSVLLLGSCTGWLNVVDDVKLGVSHNLLHRDGVRELYAWLAGWVNEDRHSATRRGYSSEEDYQRAVREDRELTRQMREAQDDADEGLGQA